MKIANFLKSKVFLIQIGIALAITIVLIWITLLNLKWYTHHGEKLTVPDLHGMSMEKAIDKIKAENLRSSVYDSMYNAKYEPGTILDQRPVAGAIVKRNRNLFLTINSKYPEQIRFPNLVDNSFRQAYELLVSSGFEIGKLEYANNQFFNLVLYPKYQGDSILAGSMIDKGATIDLVLGKGNNNKILVPNVLSKIFSQAKEKIILSNMNLGKVRFDTSVSTYTDSLHARVYKQSPSFNHDERIYPGTAIDIWLTQDTVKLQNAESLQQGLENPLY